MSEAVKAVPTERLASEEQLPGNPPPSQALGNSQVANATTARGARGEGRRQECLYGCCGDNSTPGGVGGICVTDGHQADKFSAALPPPNGLPACNAMMFTVRSACKGKFTKYGRKCVVL